MERRINVEHTSGGFVGNQLLIRWRSAVVRSLMHLASATQSRSFKLSVETNTVIQ